MSAFELYEEIKAALKYFDLGFNQMNEVKVGIDDNLFCLQHGNKTIVIDVNKESI